MAAPLGVRLAASYIGGLLTLVSVAIAGAAISGVVFLAGLPLIAYAAFRGLRIALVADDAGIVIRNYLRTYRLRWEDVGEIGIGFDEMGGELTEAIYFRRKGRRRVVTAQATMLSKTEPARVLRELQQLRPDIPVHGST